MARVASWSSEDWSKNLKQRLDSARKYRELFEPQWAENRNTIHNSRGRETNQFNLTFDNVVELESGKPDAGDSEVGMNYAFKYLRFFHSQLSANPPSVIARPASSDPVDRRKADAADRLVRYAIKNLDMQEVVDQATLNTLLLGTGWLKIIWDPDQGDVFDFNEQTSEVTMEGDISCYSPQTEDVWIDPDAKRFSDVRYIIERISMPLEQGEFLFPDQREALRNNTLAKADDMKSVLETNPAVEPEQRVIIFEYYEKGAPVNGMAGRHARFLEDGTILGTPGKNPHYNTHLPYHIFTYLDVPHQVYGKSTVEYVAHLQAMLNRLDSSILDNIQAHGVVRMAVAETTEIQDSAISNSAWDYIKYTGSQPPAFIPPPSLMQDIWQFRTQLVTAIQELYGINDSMLGIQRREQSAVSQQTAIEAGTMIHRRVFKKYAMFAESIYRQFLGLVKDNWDTSRTILVLGKEKAFEAADLKGADIDGGFDIVVEYGASLPLDPNMRREAIMLLMEPLKEAGLSMRQILRMMKLNDLDAVYDRLEMAGDRQREIFEEMIMRFEQGIEAYIPPEDLEEHKGMLEYAYDFLVTSEFKYLKLEIKTLIRQHVKERERMAAQGPEQAPMAPGVLPAGMPGVGGAQPAQMATPPGLSLA